MHCSFFLSLLLCLVPYFEVYGQQTGYLNSVNQDVSPLAACLDGSSPSYYINLSADKVNDIDQSNWLIFFEGGGWCNSDDDCYQRSLTDLGSSANYSNEFDFDAVNPGYFSSNATKNPDFYNWVKVYIKYCDGSSHTSNFMDPVNVPESKNSKGTKQIFYRGMHNKEAFFVDFEKKFPSIKSASNIVVSGCSAGGLASTIHTDWVSERYSDAFVVGLPDSGFFLHRNDDRCTLPYEDLMKWVFTRQNSTSGVNQNCIKHYTQTNNEEDAYQCIFSQFSLQYTQSPVFILNSKVDEWSLMNIYCSDPTDEETANDLGNTMSNTITEIQQGKANIGGFIDGCLHHCTAVDSCGEDFHIYYSSLLHLLKENKLDDPHDYNTWNGLHSKETKTLPIETPQSLFSTWYKQQKSQQKNPSTYFYLEEAKYPCEACCS